jgi:hypothetical protein
MRETEVSPSGRGTGCAFVHDDDCIVTDEVPDYAAGAFFTDVTNKSIP